MIIRFGFGYVYIHAVTPLNSTFNQMFLINNRLYPFLNERHKCFFGFYICPATHTPSAIHFNVLEYFP